MKTGKSVLALLLALLLCISLLPAPAFADDGLELAEEEDVPLIEMEEEKDDIEDHFFEFEEDTMILFDSEDEPLEPTGSVSSSFLKNCSASYKSGKYYTNLSEVYISGNLANDLVAVATSQIGYHEGNSWDDISGTSTGSGNYTEYNKWYPVGAQAWCNLFVSWCCAAAGISTSVAPKNPFYLDKWRSCGANVYSWGEYAAGYVTPKAGDIIVFGTSSTKDKSGSELTMSTKHIGIVTGFSNGTFYSIEGNVSDKVVSKSFTPNSSTGYLSSSNYVHAIIQPTYNQCSHTYETVNNGSGHYVARCTKCGYEYQPVFSNDSKGTYRTTSDIYLNNDPYQEAQTSIYYQTGTQVSISGHVINAYGNRWYKTDNGYYIFSAYLEKIQSADPYITISGETKPTGDLPLNKGFSLRGVIQSYPALTNVTAQVIDTNTGNAVSGFYYSVNPNSTTYNIQTDGVDQALKFGNLPAGNYRYLVTAKNASLNKTLISSYFTMGGGSTTYPAPPDAPSVSVNGQSVTVSWNDVANETSYDVYLLQAPWGWEDIKYSKSVSANTTSCTFSNVVYGDYAAFVISRPNSDSVQSQWTDFSVSEQSAILDLNGFLDGVMLGDISGYGVVDVYINGALAAADIADYCEALPVGSTYEIKNIRAADRHCYNGVYSGILSGTVGTERTEVWLSFSTCYDLDLNGLLDGAELWSIEECGTADIYINGVYKETTSDFCGYYWPSGTTYEIKNIRPYEGISYDGISDIAYEGHIPEARAGTITQDTSVRLIFHTCPTSISENPSPVVFGGHTYYYFSTPVTWYDAKSICAAMGGHLATISSESENEFVFQISQGAASWLGATDIEQEGKWQWITGEAFSYSHWDNKSPDNYKGNAEGSENYLQYSNAGKWNDNAGCSLAPFVCEIDAVLELPVPAGLFADNNCTTGRVRLSWEAVEGATGYNVYRSLNAEGSYEKMNASPITATTYTDNRSGNAGTTYYYRISAQRGEEEGPLSNTISRVSRCQRPTGLQARSNSDGSITLSWDEPAVPGSVSAYRIYQWNGSHFIWIGDEGSHLTARKTTATISPFYLNPGVDVQFSVRGYNEKDIVGSLSIYSLPVTAAAADPLFSAPDGLSCDNNGTTGRVRLSWKAVDGATGYNVYRSLSADGSYEKMNDSLITATVYTDNRSGSAGTRFYYRISAVRGDEESAFSETVSHVSRCQRPTGLKSSANSDGSVTLRWDSPLVAGSVSYYRIYLWNGERFVWLGEEGNHLVTSGTSIIIPAKYLTSGVPTEFSVRGYNSKNILGSISTYAAAVIATPW